MPRKKKDKIVRIPIPLRVPFPKMPKTRAECVNSPRPCLHLTCRYNLFLDVKNKDIIFYSDDPTKVARSCALDEAEKGGLKLEEISLIMNLSRERIRQIIEHGLRQMRFKKCQDS